MRGAIHDTDMNCQGVRSSSGLRSLLVGGSETVQTLSLEPMVFRKGSLDTRSHIQIAMMSRKNSNTAVE